MSRAAALSALSIALASAAAETPPIPNVQHYNDWHSLDGRAKRIKDLSEVKVDKFNLGAVPLNYEYGPLYASLGPALGPKGVREDPPALNSTQHRCTGTLGTWCRSWWGQTPIPWKPAPRGSKECKNNCNGVGVCNYDTGLCQCTAGWTGADCTRRDMRPCAHRHRNPDDPLDQPVHQLDEFGVDTNWSSPGWTASRCGGVCDADRGLCMCGEGSKFRRINPPPGSPPGTPPVQFGRPLVEPCQPGWDSKGKRAPWGNTKYEDLYGPDGWCNAEPGQGKHRCGCAVEGWAGSHCEKRTHVYCGNQCNLRGTCDVGYCKCDPGWYGTFCERKKAGLQVEPVNDKLVKELKEVYSPVQAALDPPPKAVRKRPLIYIYDLPSEFNTRYLQGRNFAPACTWRGFTDQNTSIFRSPGYGAEIYLHEALSTSPHRTFDPEEADFFFMPAYLTCYIWPINAWTDGPWYGAPIHDLRVYHASGLMQTVKDWVAKTFPYWDKRQGRDHIFITLHDEGACYMSNDIFKNSIFLTHWGRMDLNHTSGTAYGGDDYNRKVEGGWAKFVKGDWRDTYRGHPCYDPRKDLVIPHFKNPGDWQESPLAGNAPVVRDVLCFFRGDIGMHRLAQYSRGIRQTLFRLAHENGWREKYKIYIGERTHYDGGYSQLLRRSKFCVVAPGDGHSARAEDAILHGCIPVVIMDNVHAAFENAIDWSLFSIRVPQARMQDLPQILLAINETRLAEMQQNLANVWHRFAYMAGPMMRHDYGQRLAERHGMYKQILERVPEKHPFRPYARFPAKQDAFHTIIAWLYSRIPYTQGVDASHH